MKPSSESHLPLLACFLLLLTGTILFGVRTGVYRWIVPGASSLMEPGADDRLKLSNEEKLAIEKLLEIGHQRCWLKFQPDGTLNIAVGESGGPFYRLNKVKGRWEVLDMASWYQ